MTPLQEIERDLEWREAEIAVLKIFLSNTTISIREKLVLFRAGWALLYAHYEGFCKFSLTVYYDEISKRGILNKNLPEATKIFSLTDCLKSIRALPATNFLEKIKNFQSEHLDTPAKFPEVDTNSNLWPSTFDFLLCNADLKIDSLDENRQKIATLVSRRNKIAHGERDMILEYDYFISYEKAVSSIMVELAIKIDEKFELLN